MDGEHMTELGRFEAARTGEVTGESRSKFRCHADNVLVRLLPLPTRTASGIYTPPSEKRRVTESREAVVVASGPGYHNKSGKLVPNETKAGDRVLVPAQAGDIWHSALSAPRFNKTAEFTDLMGEEGEFRCVREQEILGVLEAECASSCP